MAEVSEKPFQELKKEGSLPDLSVSTAETQWSSETSVPSSPSVDENTRNSQDTQYTSSFGSGSTECEDSQLLTWVPNMYLVMMDGKISEKAPECFRVQETEFTLVDYGYTFYFMGEELPFVCNSGLARFRNQVLSSAEMKYQYYVPPMVENYDFFGGQQNLWQVSMMYYFSRFIPTVWRLQALPEVVHHKQKGWIHYSIISKLRFCCRSCHRPWTTMRGKIMFTFGLDTGFSLGLIFMKIFGQVCMQENCSDRDFQTAANYPEEIDRIMKKLSNYIGHIYYHMPLAIDSNDQNNSPIRGGNPKSLHRRELCQACFQGMCSKTDRGVSESAELAAKPPLVFNEVSSPDISVAETQLFSEVSVFSPPYFEDINLNSHFNQSQVQGTPSPCQYQFSFDNTVCKASPIMPWVPNMYNNNMEGVCCNPPHLPSSADYEKEDSLPDTNSSSSSSTEAHSSSTSTTGTQTSPESSVPSSPSVDENTRHSQDTQCTSCFDSTECEELPSSVTTWVPNMYFAMMEGKISEKAPECFNVQESELTLVDYGYTFYFMGEELPFVCNSGQARFRNQVVSSAELKYQYYVPPMVENYDFFGGQQNLWQIKMMHYFSRFTPTVWRLQALPEVVHHKQKGWIHYSIISKLRFCCRTCHRPWTTMRGKIMFTFGLDTGFSLGLIFMKIFGQVCMQDACNDRDFQAAANYPEEIDRIMKKLSIYIGHIYYNMPLSIDYYDQNNSPVRGGNPKSLHRRELCQACFQGMCSKA